MRRVFGLEGAAAPARRAAVTIGKFLAVHRGHQALLAATVAAAQSAALRSVAFTFDRHPREVLEPGTQLPVLATLEERLDAIAACGIEETIVVPLTPSFLALEPETFIREILWEHLGCAEVLASAGFRFGHRAAGTADTLRSVGNALGFRFTAVPPVFEGGEPISTSRVAVCIQSGAVATAATLLGYPYALSGTVARGDQVGRRLGFPTANVAVSANRLLPGDGVYVVRLETQDASLPAVANLGVRPTVDGVRRLLEVHVPGWEGDLYGQTVRVAFLERLREERRFPDLEALREQIGADVCRAREWHRLAGAEGNAQ